ncbi:NAD(P)H-dependent oxidoreductase [Kitasatospora sp. NBC_01287]|uniref:FMN-dependent NADH-azoreductase n=1 Tax=Kitasatospora sp. NBC_01287 TaxID=2903573 RepID=UPI00224E059E|nr:NAD(P)H-dependent oxidoreductase [Kitasatospora sp. NBC_01287]MCX4744389.1 NAD(P)H-dependent oxidoreductase [Kitasatospora sp. NBC_01287]
MTTLLHIDTSISTAEESVSRRLTERFAAAWRTAHGAAGYRYRDLAADPVPMIGSAYARLGQRVERQGTLHPAQVAALVQGPAEEREWALTRPLIEEVLAADTVLLGVPMYNLAIPATLKAWIDRISFPGAFTDPGTGESLLRGAEVVVVTARGGGYGPGTPREAFDHQMPYLRAYFGNLGVAEANLRFVHAELTRAADIPALAGLQELGEASLAAAGSAVDALAAGNGASIGAGSGTGGLAHSTVG